MPDPQAPIISRLTQLLSIDYPIVQGGMVWAAGSALVAAVSQAGGLGLLGSGSMYPDMLRAEIRRVRAVTDRPFGVNVSLRRDDSETLLQIVMDEGVPVVSCSLGNPGIYVERMKARGIKTMHVVTNTRHAAKAEQAGVDALIAVGIEAGGHPGPDELALMTLIPQLRDATDLPLVAAGGIADGRGLAAALALGADGVQIGTRFIATDEASVHQSYKEMLVQAGTTDSVLIARNVELVRVLKNRFSIRISQAQIEGATPEAILGILREGRPKLTMHEGDVQNGQVQAGQGVGLIQDIVPTAELMRRIVSQYWDARAAMPRASSAVCA
jgi:enoyl-[acyl-carrier protein] reductase II